MGDNPLSLCILFLNRSDAGPGISVCSLVQADILPRLNAFQFSDLTWITNEELLEYANEAAKELGMNGAVFVERDGSTSVVPGATLYPVPTGWIDTMHASVQAGDGSFRPVRASSLTELNALDFAYATSSDVLPSRYSHDANPQNTLVYPTPTQAATLWLVIHKYPPTVSTASCGLLVPWVVRLYFLYKILQNARQRQSEAMMPEMAQHFKARADMLKQMIVGYWGEDE